MDHTTLRNRHSANGRENPMSSASPDPSTVTQDIEKAQLRADNAQAIDALYRNHYRQVASLKSEKDRLRYQREDIGATGQDEQEQLEKERKELEATNARRRRRNTALEGKLRPLQATEVKRLDEKAVLEAAEQQLERETRELHAANDSLVRENEELAARLGDYAIALATNIEQLQTYAPPLALPLELLSTIAGFVAGANDFGTLASLCRTAKYMLRECESTLYETVEWEASLMARFEEGKRVAQYPKQFQFIKFLFIDHAEWRQLQQSVEARFEALPNIVIIVEKRYGPVSNYHYHTIPPRYVAEIFYQKPSTLATLSSILKYPLIWKLQGEAPSHSPVLAIDRAMVGSGGSVTRGACAEEDMFRPTLGGIHWVSVSCWEYMEDRQGEQEVSIRELAQLVLSAKQTSHVPARHQLDVQVDQAADMDAWLHEWHHWLARDPHLSPDFQITDTRDLTAAEFTDLAIKLCRIYENHLHRVDCHRGDVSSQAQRAAEMSFYLMDYEANGDDSLRFNAYILRFPYARGLHLVITEFSPAEDPEQDEAHLSTILLNEVYVPQLRRRIPAEDAQPYLRARPAGDQVGEPGEESVSTSSGNENATTVA